ncbi:MAG: hypothetical protein PHR39_01700, partial [Actinomycetota bacterium]|nr:hypothetical protein [Actinomycetota bacterium]
PSTVQNLIFEARVTSKLENAVKDIYGFNGRGMALFSIKLNADDIKIIFSKEGQGTSMFLDIDLEKVPEKKDQSVFPQIIDLDGNMNIIGGVNNIPKTLVEFSLQNPDINVYYGTPSQIITSMRNNLKNSNISADYPKFDNWDFLINYLNNNNKVKVNFIPYLTENYLILSKITKTFFNMEISERTVQRIAYDEIKSIDPIDTSSLVHIKKIENETLDEKDEEKLPNNDKVCSKNESGKASNLNSEDKIGLAKNLVLHDGQKLALRFKDDEISDIIKEVNEKIKKIGSKYLIEPDNNINFKKCNNIIRINIELKEV